MNYDYYRGWAKTMRTIAGNAHSPSAKETLLKAADNYDAMADAARLAQAMEYNAQPRCSP